MAARSELSNADLVCDVLRTADRPLTFQEIFDRVTACRPITTRNPKGTVRSALQSISQLINAGGGRYGYLPHLLQGSLVRLLLTEKKPANHPLIFSEEVRLALWPSFFESQKRKNQRPVRARLPDGGEVVLPLELLGTGTWGCAMPAALHDYLVAQRAAADDSLLIRIVDGEAGVCEIQWESRLKRDKDAIAARNEALADLAAALFQERRVDRLPIWDLTLLLLARGAYLSEIAPDPLESVLAADARFTSTGFGDVHLTEAMTPATQAEIREREQLRRALFSIGPDDLLPPLDLVEPPDLPLAGPRMLERALADIGAFLQERAPASDDEANALLQGLLAQGGVPHREAATPLERAQELIYEAHESESSRERVRLAREALKLSADCADAYVLLAEETARTPEDAATLYAQGVAAGERALGDEVFEQDVGMFWGILETRPYMRARLGLAQALWAMGEHQAAVDHLQDMLRLNPGDNQGVRYLLLDWLLEIDAPERVQALFDAYPDDASAIWLYGRALHEFRRQGDTPETRRLLGDARDWNVHVPAYLTGRKRVPRRLPMLIGMGDESEAIVYAAEQTDAWRSTPGAIDWLRDASRRSTRG
jgi:tetratricopeptide (TPR) repeat protein